jgi:hypothetical protein
VNRSPSRIASACRCSALALAALAAAALCSGASAQAVVAHSAVVDSGVVFPSPGAMTVHGLPAQIRAGHTFTLRANLPLATWSGKLLLQEQDASGTWNTLVSGAGLRLFWLHWKVPSRWAGSSFTARFVLMSGAQVLAMSPNYTLTVAR